MLLSNPAYYNFLVNTRCGHQAVVARLKMNDGLRIAAVPDSDQIGSSRAHWSHSSSSQELVLTAQTRHYPGLAIPI